MRVVFFGFLSDTLRLAFEREGISILDHVQQDEIPPKNLHLILRMSRSRFMSRHNQNNVAVVSFWYPYKIPAYRIKYAINAHPTLLPYGRGQWPIPELILSGKKYAGLTIHALSGEFDQGDIIYQIPIKLLNNDSQDIYLAKILATLIFKLPATIENIDKLWLLKKKQNNTLERKIPLVKSLHTSMGCKKIQQIVACHGRGETLLLHGGKTIHVDYVVVSLATNDRNSIFPLTGVEDLPILETESSITFLLSDGIIIFYKWAKTPRLLYDST